jgi:hypothetical protein
VTFTPLWLRKLNTNNGEDGKWLLTEIWQDNLKTSIPDTSDISETLEISGTTFISSSTKTRKIWNSGTFDCSKVFDADSVSFKKGSNAYFNLYVKR